MIREARRSDFDAILDMAESFWGHTQFDEPFDRDHTEVMVKMSYDNDLLCVSEDKSGITGFIAAVKSPLIGSPRALMATELAWYVKPENRGTMHGVQLIKLLESLCIEQEVKYLSMAFMETSMPAKIKKLYESLGYVLQETVYTKVLHGSNNRNSGCGSGSSVLGKPPAKIS